MTATLAPAPVEAEGRPLGHFPFAAGPRFLTCLLLGFLWLIPTGWSPRFFLALAVWDVVLVIAWLIDFVRLPNPAQLSARRYWESAPTLAQTSTVRIELTNSGSSPIQASMIDEVPNRLGYEPPAMFVMVPAGGTESHDYEVRPTSRGDAQLGRLYIRYQSGARLAERRATMSLEQTARVFPDLAKAREFALYLIRSRQIEMEKRRRRQRGLGREFQTLREYRAGDEMRDICWPATARRHQLTTRVYQVERSQVVWIVLDAGRLLRALVPSRKAPMPVSKLDYAVDAALALAQVVTQSGDRVGMLAYGRSIQQALGPGRGAHHLRALVDSLAVVQAESAEANHANAVHSLLRKQTRRSLIVWITDFAETAITPEVIEYASEMSRKHVVVFAAVRQADLLTAANVIPLDIEQMFHNTAAVEVMQRRDLLIRNLRHKGILAVDLPPGGLADSLVNQYLEVKDRSLL